MGFLEIIELSETPIDFQLTTGLILVLRLCFGMKKGEQNDQTIRLSLVDQPG